RRAAAGSRAGQGPPFLGRLLEAGPFGAGLLEGALGLVELLAGRLELLLGGQGAFLPALAAGGGVAGAGLGPLWFLLPARGLGLPLVPALRQLGDENARRAAERGGRSVRRRRAFHDGCSGCSTGNTFEMNTASPPRPVNPNFGSTHPSPHFGLGG